MPDSFVQWFSLFISSVLVLGFFILYGTAIIRVWRAPRDGTDPAQKFPQNSQVAVWIVTALAGLIGGVVAAGFGQKAPAPPARDVSPMALRVESLTLTMLLGTGDGFTLQEWLAMSYAITYFLVGMAAIVTLLLRRHIVTDLVRNLALIVFGLMLAIGQSFVGGNAGA